MRKVMTFGAFDVLHDGHRSLFRQARRFGGRGSRLLVVVASDERYRMVKGRRPWYSQSERMEMVRKEGLADEVLKGDRLNTLKVIFRHKPEVIVFGYDQPLSTRELGRMLKREGFVPERIVRARPFRPDRYKSSLLKEKIGMK